MTTDMVGQIEHITVEHIDGTLDAEVKLLGFASSQRDMHRTDRSCSHCRWTEVRIYRSPDKDDDGFWTYYVRTSGASSIPNERRFERVLTTNSALRVMEALTHRRDGKVSIPRISIDAITEAAGRDDDLFEAWVERAVA